MELSLDFLPTGEVLLDGADLTCTVAGRLVVKLTTKGVVACVVVLICMCSFRRPPTQSSRATNREHPYENHSITLRALDLVPYREKYIYIYLRPRVVLYLKLRFMGVHVPRWAYRATYADETNTATVGAFGELHVHLLRALCNRLLHVVDLSSFGQSSTDQPEASIFPREKTLECYLVINNSLPRLHASLPPSGHLESRYNPKRPPKHGVYRNISLLLMGAVKNR